METPGKRGPKTDSLSAQDLDEFQKIVRLLLKRSGMSAYALGCELVSAGVREGEKWVNEALAAKSLSKRRAAELWRVLCKKGRVRESFPDYIKLQTLVEKDILRSRRDFPESLTLFRVSKFKAEVFASELAEFLIQAKALTKKRLAESILEYVRKRGGREFDALHGGYPIRIWPSEPFEQRVRGSGRLMERHVVERINEFESRTFIVDRLAFIPVRRAMRRHMALKNI